MRSAFAKDVTRSIKHSMGRFIAIAIIAALGTGFYAGLRMTGPDMYIAADQYYDATNASDLRVAGTLGLDDASIEALRQVDGVEAVEPEREVDALCVIGGIQYPTRIHSLNIAAASASDTSDGLHAVSDDPDYINRPLLMEGRWPTSDSECLVSYDAVLDSDVEIGDTIDVSSVLDNDSVTDALKYDKLTVVGFARWSYYPSASTFGSTSLGDGQLADYLLIPDTAFAEDFPYTGAFITATGARDLTSGTAEYKELVSELADRIDAVGVGISEDRYNTVVSDAQSELDDNKADYEQQKADAISQLDDAKAQLDDALAELSDAADQIAESQAELDNSAATIEEGQASLDAALADYQSGVDQLNEARDNAATQFAAAQDQIDTQRAAANAQLSTLQGHLQTANDTKTQLEQQITYLEAQVPRDETAIATAQARLAQVQAGIDQLTAGIAQVQAGLATLDDSQAQLDAEKAATQTKLDEEQAKLEAGKEQLDQTAAQLQSGREQLASGQAAIDEARAQYQSGMDEYNSGLAEYEDNKATADSELADAETKITDAQAKIDDIRNPDWYTLDRTKNTGQESYRLDSDRIDHIAQVFPFIFFLVAALVSLTTMTRMVDEERTLVGTYKALGYSNAKIIAKYLIYAISACVIGSLVGVLFLTQFLPYFIMNAYAIMYQIPTMPTPIDPALGIGSSLLSLAIVVAATWWATASTLREKAAQLLLPKAPKPGKRILLERIKPLWNRISFSWKVTFRNIFRYKRRFFMVIVGIAGCTALLLTGFGLENSINDIIDKQYGDNSIIQYDVSVRTTDDATQQDLQNIDAYLASSPDAAEYENLMMEDMAVTSDSSGSKEYRFTIVVPEDPSVLQDLVEMHPRSDRSEAISLDESGVVITEKLATELGVGVGDTVRVYEMDTVGNAIGTADVFTVGAIMENYVGNDLYVTPSVYEQTMGENPDYNSYIVKASDVSGANDNLTGTLQTMDGVSTASSMVDTIAYYRKALKSVDAVVIVLIVAAAALAFVVLYNLTNINISERAREIATLKVLGFRKKEYVSYIFRETVILSIIGGLVGLLLGIFLEQFVVVTAEVDLVMFGREIHALSFLISFALTMVFTVFVVNVMKGKLHKISMVESLKSVD